MPDPPILFCLPHAGAAAAVYRPWVAELGDVARVVPIEPPGRGGRRREEACTSLDALVAAVRPQLDDALTDGDPFLLYGHSLGSLVACALARELTADGRPPRALVVSGRNGPSRASVGLPMHRRSDEDLLALLDDLGGTPPEIAGDDELMRMFLGPLRADLRVAETSDRPAPGTPLRCPIVVLQGEDDGVVSEDGAEAWRDETTGPFDLRWYPGAHFFTHEPGFVGGRLRGVLADAAACAATGTGSVR